MSASLQSILGTPLAAPATPGCHASRCGSAAGEVARLTPEQRTRVQDHPCYAEDAHRHFARMHVAVAPACNIQCNYCNRKYDCSNESRPGVTSAVLNPQEAVEKVVAVAAAIPQLSVVGIAGPGDALANPQRSFAFLHALRERAPDLRLCLSTNGLALPEHVDEIVAAGVDHVTITINAIDPDVGALIYPWIFWQRQRIHGRKAAQILIAQQLAGLAALSARGVLVKINSVLIPGINDQHLPAVARAVRERGAFLHNVMPLISAPEHGTVFGLAGQRGPTPAELDALRQACASDMHIMRHCQQCRADAVGMLGEDRASEFSAERIATMQIDENAASARRMSLRAQINAGQEAALASTTLASGLFATPARARSVQMAVATRGSGLIDEHFGHARALLVFDVDGRGARFLGVREVGQYCTGEATCGEEEARLAQTVAALVDCEVLLCARIGYQPWTTLAALGIRPNAEHAMEPIADALMRVWLQMYEGGQLATGPFADSLSA